MLSLKVLVILGSLAAVMVVAQSGAAWAGEASPRNDGGATQSRAQPTRTGKERLGGKASDEQRVDNCRVPLDLRGPTPRPANCGDAVGRDR
jgi:hypothetical protein